jgi:hypothetical protein
MPTGKSVVASVAVRCIFDPSSLCLHGLVYHIRQGADVHLRRRSADLTSCIAVESTTLPRGIHPDPADWFLIAMARMLDATLVSHDRRILGYGSAAHVKVMAA